MAEPRAEVRNAADAQQVRGADRRERRRLARFDTALREVMRTEAGRAVLWGLLERARVFESIWHPSALIHYNAGRQDFGHELLGLLTNADEELYLTMEREARIRAKRDAHETDAAHTAPADAGGNDGSRS